MLLSELKEQQRAIDINSNTRKNQKQSWKEIRTREKDHQQTPNRKQKKERHMNLASVCRIPLKELGLYMGEILIAMGFFNHKSIQISLMNDPILL